MSYFTEQLENILVWSVPMDSKAQTKKLIERIQKLVDEEVLGKDDPLVENYYDRESEGTRNGYLRLQGTRMLRTEARARLYGEGQK